MSDCYTIKEQYEEIERLQKQLEAARELIYQSLAEIEEWKLASGLEVGGDPDGVTPAAARRYWEELEARRNAWRQLAKDMGEFLSMACPNEQAWVGDGGLAERLDALEFQGSER